MGRNAIRPFIRSVVGCPACGAAKAARCVAYVLKPGRTVGKPSEDVHAARWKAFRDWQDQRLVTAVAAAPMIDIDQRPLEPFIQVTGQGPRTQWVVYEQAPVIPAHCIGVPDLPAEYYDCG